MTGKEAGNDSKIRWVLYRLSCMSLAEIVYRVWVSIKILLEKRGFLLALNVPLPDVSPRPENWIHEPVTIESNDYCNAARKIMSDHINVFSLKGVKIGDSYQWNTDPLSGMTSPLVFGKTLDYRNASLVGNIKFLWEPNRHLHLVTLAQAYYLSCDESCLDTISSQLDSWFEQCPYPSGPNWSSALESGIRLINWSIVWQLTGGIDSTIFKGVKGEKFLHRWLTSIYQHMYFIHGHLSKYSSANNHLMGEITGLFVGTIAWPYWDKTEAWRIKAKRILEKEALLQNEPDGVNKEQAVGYQQYVMDFMIIAALAGRSNGINFQDRYWKRIEVMMEFIASIMDVGGNIPMIGDADDGSVTCLSQESNFCQYHSLLATGALLFNRGDFKQKAGRLDDKTKWLMGDQAAHTFNSIIMDENTRLPVRQAFSKGGYYILGSNFEKDNEIRIITDTGPLGYQKIAAHGHADALAFTLSVGGHEFLVDPGTFSYHTQKKWRDYFRGTSAHNTVRVDGQDQSVSGGNFMWLRHANAWCTDFQTGVDMDYFCGGHDGYTRLADPLIHKRELRLDKHSSVLSVEDTLECSSNHSIERLWHFAEDCEITLENGRIKAEKEGISVIIDVEGGNSEPIIMRGDGSAPGGWVSRHFDVKCPSTTVVWRNKIKASVRLETEISCIFPQ